MNAGAIARLEALTKQVRQNSNFERFVLRLISSEPCPAIPQEKRR